MGKDVIKSEDYCFSKTFTGLCPGWINAPSALQPAHRYHGRNVVAMRKEDGSFICCLIDEKKANTFRLHENTCIVPGWK